ncbi:MAG: alpha/beta fold hydrolase [bacterium]
MELFCKEYGSNNSHLIILHGLLSSGRNWHTICSNLAEKHHIIVPDMRNHGRSGHSDEHHLSDMVNDVLDVQNRFEIKSSFMLGHSMGGLAAMDFAFNAPEKIEGLIIIDIPPRPHQAGVAFVLDAMLGVRLEEMKSKSEVDEALLGALPDPLVRQFVLSNLHFDTGGFRWRANVPVLREFLLESQAYQPPPANVFEGPTLFIRGGRSDYIRNEDFPIIRNHFPNARIETVEKAGHWVHHDAPDEILQLVDGFMRGVAKK